jgi:hypothetical protein
VTALRKLMKGVKRTENLKAFPALERTEADHDQGDLSIAAADLVKIGTTELTETEETFDLLNVTGSTITEDGRTTEELSTVIAWTMSVGVARGNNAAVLIATQDQEAGKCRSQILQHTSHCHFIHSNRSHRRRSSTPRKRTSNSDKRSRSVDKKPPREVEKQPPKKAEDADDIAELERRVQEAKKVLEVMVQLKKKRSSTSSEDQSRGKKRSNKTKRDSSSD